MQVTDFLFNGRARETREAILFIAKLLVAYARVRRFDEKGRGEIETKNQRWRGKYKERGHASTTFSRASNVLPIPFPFKTHVSRETVYIYVNISNGKPLWIKVVDVGRAPITFSLAVISPFLSSSLPFSSVSLSVSSYYHELVARNAECKYTCIFLLLKTRRERTAKNRMASGPGEFGFGRFLSSPACWRIGESSTFVH